MEIEKGIEITNRFFIDKKNKVLALADLHLGFEEGIGLLLRQQMDKIINDVEREVKKYNIKKIVICGDLKQEFGKHGRQEWEEIEVFLKRLSKNKEIIITKGNHDFYIENMSKRIAKVVDVIEIGGITYAHGHKRVDWKKMLVIGNEHPALKIKDKLGALYNYPVFLYFRKERIIVLPTANPWTKGTNVLEEQFISKPLENADKKNAEVYAIEDDITFIGKIKEIKYKIN